ncbi:MAG: tRNA-dihydrouridine synthase [bacterium]
MKNFWQKLKNKKKPIFALAPMAGIADSAFRQICKSFGADIVYSEMISAAAIFHNSRKTFELARFDKTERPFVLQLFGSNPAHFACAAKLVTKKIKPDGIDINFGCPAKKVAKQGAGAALMNNLELSRLIVKAVLDNTDLPVSVKCRSSAGQITVLDFLKKIKDLPVAAVMIHGRDLSQGHSGKVDWKIIKQAKKYFSGIILANGGVRDKKIADEMLKLSQADGIGIGQGALGRPWIFDEVKNKKLKIRSNKDIYQAALKHAILAEKLKGKQGIVEMRKHLCWYAGGMKNASALRLKLARVENLSDIENILHPLFSLE